MRNLHEAKMREGRDFCVHSSFCSDQSLIVVLVRRPGARLSTPIVDFDLARALERAIA
jgi:hypothetical protein